MTNPTTNIPGLGGIEVKNGAVRMSGQMDDGELLTGTPTVAEDGTADLTITNVGINVAELALKCGTAAIGKAVVWSVSGALEGVLYTLVVTASTDSVPPQTLSVRVQSLGQL